MILQYPRHIFHIDLGDNLRTNTFRGCSTGSLLNDKKIKDIQEQLQHHNNVSQAARDFSLSRRTIMRVRDS